MTACTSALPSKPRGERSMQATLQLGAAVAAPFDNPPVARVALERLVVGFMGGALVAALTWRGGPGVGWLVADAVLVAAAVGFVARGRPGLAGWVLAATSVWLAGAAAFYASAWAAMTAAPASAVALVALGLTCARR